MKALIFEKSRILGVEHRVANSNVTSRLKVVAEFTSTVAQAMEARWVLFDREQIPKAGYKAIELDFELKSFRFDFGVPKLGTLQLTSELADHFKVLRQGDGKKKPRRLMVQFRIHHAGSPFELIEWLIRIGGADGRMELSPLQQELFQQEKAGEQKRSKRKPIEVKPGTSDAGDFAAEDKPFGEPSNEVEKAEVGPALASKSDMERTDNVREFQKSQLEKIRKGGGRVS